MRLWSIHPKYLDPQGLVALWREGLLAQKVLAGKTKGYRHHPQLIRFRETKDVMAFIGLYLDHVQKEATQRNYNFDRSKILKLPIRKTSKINVTNGQIKYETEHLIKKLKKRNPHLLRQYKDLKVFSPHPLFKVVKGGVQSWEIVD